MDIKNARILVTGATGCVGRALIGLLSTLDYGEILALSRNAPDNPYPDINYITGDICDRTLMQSLISNVDIIIHLAAKVHKVPQNVEQIREFFSINHEASEDIFKMALEEGVKKVIFVSSTSVYGHGDKVSLNEDDDCDPKTPYTQSKYMAEEALVRLNTENGLPMTILRLVNVFGNGDKGNFKTIADIVRQGLVPVISKGENRKTFIYSKDVARAILEVIKNEKTDGKIYNVKGFEITVGETIEKLGEIFDIKPCTIPVPSFIIELCGYLGQRMEFFNRIMQVLAILGSSKTYSAIKFAADTDFKPKYDIVTGLKDSFDYYNSKKSD